jgi:hypothetical protein
MSSSRVQAYPCDAPFRCSTLGLTHKHRTRLERRAKDKHSSLLQQFINYSCKEFYNFRPRTKQPLVVVCLTFETENLSFLRIAKQGGGINLLKISLHMRQKQSEIAIKCVFSHLNFCRKLFLRLLHLFSILLSAYYDFSVHFGKYGSFSQNSAKANTKQSKFKGYQYLNSKLDAFSKF